MTAKTTRDHRFAGTLAKGLQVLQAFSHEDRTLGVRELARRTGMPPSTVSRMTYTLSQFGYLQKVPQGNVYRLGPAAMALGYTARAGFYFLPTAEPIMQALADEIGALVALAVRHGDAVMLCRCWRPRNTPAIWLTEGHRLPLAGSAPGRVILAVDGGASEDQGLTEDRVYVQAHGYLLSIGGWNTNINACAVPFRPEPEQGAAAFLCGAQKDVLPRERLERQVAPRLRACVSQLERSIGLPGIGMG